MVIGMRQTLMLALMVTASLESLTAADAQEPPDELTPRAIADSTYAVRLTVDALAEGIRHGRLDLREFNDPLLASAVGNLASAAARRSRRPPHADLGILWDLQIDVSNFQPEGRDVLRARADVLLATAPDSARAHVTLTFRRRGDRWDLAAHEGLTARLMVIATALQTRSRL